MAIRSRNALSALGMLVLVVSTIGSANAQYRGDYYRDGPSRRDSYRDDDYDRRPSRGRCLSSDGINARIYRDGWYPEALVGQRDGGRILLMRVSQGPRKFIATVDGCTGKIYHMQGL